ncbi:uncharacterized protein LOC132042999 [Lycium ferocissimum]|uniref:uncharacterized protein LOC132042999 n=1 Tax=Lycium ferocissimum TaxID=112874 RepID=UPI0028151C21|nr:uncharacterized protein LOC132042999 [Lycium ferocissimum]
MSNTLKLVSTLEYHHPSSDAALNIWQMLSQQELSIKNPNSDYPSNSLPTSLTIKFELITHDRYWFNTDRFEHEQDHTKLLLLRFFPSTYMSFETFFYNVMRENTKNWGEEFDKNYRNVVIHDMTGKVRENMDDENNKGCQDLIVFVRGVLVVNHSLSGDDECMICFEELGKERELMGMPCSHVFHGDCITTWLEIGHSCPLCRYDILAT